MPPPNRLDPLEALRTITGRMNRRPPTTLAIDEAPRCSFLAEAISCQAGGDPDSQPPRTATRNGYALPGEGVEAGDSFRVLGTISTLGEMDTETSAAPEGAGEESFRGTGALPGAWRVETGAILPAGLDRVSRVGDTALTRSRVVRIDRIPAAGEGTSTPSTIRFEKGEALSGRLRALLAEKGIHSVSARTPFPVAVAAVGDELSSPAATGRKQDLSSDWVEDALRDLGLETIRLKPIPDTPEALRDTLLHVRGRADVLVLLGGIGDGVTDRVRESLERFDSHVLLDGVSLEGCPGLLFAKTLGVDIVGLGGKPLEAACGLDLFLRPALMARLGAASGLWSWAHGMLPLESHSSGGPGSLRANGWSAAPARRVASEEGSLVLRVLPAPNVFLPAAPGQEGWAVIPGPITTPPAPNLPASSRTAYFQPTPGR